jgi:hypothetical protein
MAFTSSEYELDRAYGFRTADLKRWFSTRVVAVIPLGTMVENDGQLAPSGSTLLL